ncbi:hypothetical protein ASG65_14875 [Bacillus sp. Leaf13]|nr:hypothetical protein ASG65_14875 [Bacillus sp. Leaf13]
MTLKDRGNIKWQSSMFLPEHVKLLKDLNKDYYRQVKPILDEYQLEEFENKIHTAMELSSTVKFTVFEDGFDWVYTGIIHRLIPGSILPSLWNHPLTTSGIETFMKDWGKLQGTLS